MNTKFSRLLLAMVAATLAGFVQPAQATQPWTTGNLPSGLVSWWRADGDTLDATGANPAVGGGQTYTPGRSGQAFQFDGISQSVAAPGSPSLDEWSQFTLEAWMKLDQTADVPNAPPGRMVINRVGNPSDHVNFNQGYQFGFWNNASNLVLAFNTNGQAWPGFVTEAVLPEPLPTNVWLHYAATYDHNAAVLYLNGVPRATNVIGPATVARSSSTFRIGMDDNGNCPFPGSVDDVRVYNRALSKDEIAWLAGGPPPTAQGIWGLKTHDPASQPPTTLFHFNEDGGGFAEIGRVAINGSEIEADGLAESPQGDLFGFWLSGGASRLIAIDPVSAAAQPVGPALTGRNLRGAAFLLSGKLIAFDAASVELVEIDPVAGTIVGQPTPITGLPAGGSTSGDLTTAPNGSVLFAANNEVYTLNLRGGGTTLLLRDSAPLRDGFEPFICGLACSPNGGPDETLFAFEATSQDDLFQYLPSAGFARSELFRNIVPAYKAGRGDLAALPAARAELLSFRINGAGAELAAVCRAGVTAWVEFADDLGAPHWQSLTDTTVLIPYTDGGIATLKTWTNLPMSESHRFYRVATQ